MGLMVAGIFLLILEVYVVSYGILSIAGLVAFTMGSLFLFHGESGFISVQYPVILSSLAGVILSIGLLVWFLYQDSRKQKKTDNFFLPVGAIGHVLTKISSKEYQVKVRGEIWKAFSDEDLSIADAVEVSDVNTKDLSLKIKKRVSNL
jgi:membrane-bound serine protease (ClpP class)